MLLFWQLLSYTDNKCICIYYHAFSGTPMPYPTAGVPPSTYPGYNLAGYPTPPTLPSMNETTGVPESAPKVSHKNM